MLSKYYWMELFGNLLNACPVDTRNMVTHITLFETPTDYVIQIAAPFVTNPKWVKRQAEQKEPTPLTVNNYAGAVNYAEKSPHNGWVEREIEHTKRIIDERYKYLGG